LTIYIIILKTKQMALARSAFFAGAPQSEKLVWYFHIAR
jgi:hypothetical protein